MTCKQNYDLTFVITELNKEYELIKEYKFHPKRRWRFDYSIHPLKLAIEIEGGTFINGRHNRGTGFINDMEKYNNAAMYGWKVLRFTPQQLNKLETYHLIKNTINTIKREIE